MNFEYSVKKLSASYDFTVTGVSSIINPKNNTIIFIGQKYLHLINNLANVKNSIVFVPNNVFINSSFQTDNCFIFVNNPRYEYGCLLEKILSENTNQPSYNCDNFALIEKTAYLGENVKIGPFSVISTKVKIGDNTIIGSGVKILENVTIGKNCIIHENAVLGTTGLAYEKSQDGVLQYIPQLGNLIIEDNVSIGAGSIIAKGAIESTVIGKGTKIDSFVFISHNCKIGKNNLFVAGANLFGSVNTGNNVFISGNSVIRNGTQIGNDSTIGMGAVVTKDIEKNRTVVGNPSRYINS